MSGTVATAPIRGYEWSSLMADDEINNEKKRRGRPPVGVAAERARERLVQLLEQQKQWQRQARAKRDEQKRVLALAMARDRHARIGKERKEERQLAFTLGRMVLEALAVEGATQAVVGPAEIWGLKPEICESLARYVIRQRESDSPTGPTTSHDLAGTCQG